MMLVPAAKLVSITVLAGLVGLSFTVEFDTQPIVGKVLDGHAIADKMAVPDMGVLLTQADMSETLVRPLFDPKRQPPEAKTASTEAIEPDPVDDNLEPAPAPETHFGLRLLGIQISLQRASALLAGSEDGQTRWIKKGEKIDNWQLVSVESDKITLRCEDKSRPDCDRVLNLYGQQPAGEGL